MTSPPAFVKTVLAATAAASTPSSPRAGSRMKIISYARTLLTSLCDPSVTSGRRNRVRCWPHIVPIHGAGRALEHHALHRVGAPGESLRKHGRLGGREVRQHPIDCVFP